MSNDTIDTLISFVDTFTWVYAAIIIAWILSSWVRLPYGVWTNRIRTFLDVLNVQQNVYSTRRDLAQAYFNYIVGWLRLKAAIGILTDTDLETINRQLRG